MRQAGEKAVERIEHHREANEQRRGVEIGAGRVHDTGVAAIQIGDSEQRREQKDTAAKTVWTIFAPPPTKRCVIEHCLTPAFRERFLRRLPDPLPEH